MHFTCCCQIVDYQKWNLTTYLSLALDLRPPLKPLAVPRECSTRILRIETKPRIWSDNYMTETFKTTLHRKWMNIKFKLITFLPSCLSHCIHKQHHRHLLGLQIPGMRGENHYLRFNRNDPPKMDIFGGQTLNFWNSLLHNKLISQLQISLTSWNRIQKQKSISFIIITYVVTKQ